VPSKIQIIPEGLLSLLGLKGGEAPAWLADQVIGVVDLTPRYLSQRLDTATTASTGGLAALGATVTLTIPERQAWDVIAANFTCTMAAAAVGPALELNVNGAAVAFLVGTDSTRANPYEASVVWTPGQQVTLRPGSTISGIIRSTPNSAITGIVRALVRRLDV